MSSSDIGKEIATAAMPDGPPHEPEIGGDLDLFNEATGDAIDLIRRDIDSVANVRTPKTTALFAGLQKEYGLIPVENATEDAEIESLETEVYKKRSNGSDDGLQDKLDRAGFDLFVYQNSPDGPAADPESLINNNFQVYCGEDIVTGNDEAYCGRLGGELVVNGDSFEQVPNFLGCGTMITGNTTAAAGYFEELIQIPIEYEVSTDPDDWPFVFIVGGVATFNPDDSILNVAQGFVNNKQKEQLKAIIVGYKPLSTSCALVVTYIN